MSSEKINVGGLNEKGFEARMQDTYVGPIHSSLLELEDLVTDIDKRKNLKDALSQARCDYDEMPEHNMDEDELAGSLSVIRSLVEYVSDPELSNAHREEIILEKLPGYDKI